MKSRFYIKINSPCKENTDNMPNTSNGLFCHSCNKNVHDLSTLNDWELKKFFNQNKNKEICAKLKINQVEKEYSFEEKRKFSFKRLFLVAIPLMLTTINKGIGQINNPTTEVKNPNSPKKDTKVEKGKIRIEGRLIDSKTRKGLNKCVIKVKGYNSKAITDENGNFAITILTKNDQHIHLIINRTGYNELEKTVFINRSNIELGIIELNDICIKDDDKFITGKILKIEMD